MKLPEILRNFGDWKPTYVFSEDYLVSDTGLVYSRRNESLLKPSEDKDGYLYYVLCVNGNRKTVKAHRLVATAFIPNTDGKPTIDHINANVKDNRVCNLRWASYEEQWENPISRIRHATGALKAAEKIRGKPSKQRRMVSAYKDGNLIGSYPSMTHAANALGVNLGKVSECVNGKRHTTGGYSFSQIG